MQREPTISFFPVLQFITAVYMSPIPLCFLKNNLFLRSLNRGQQRNSADWRDEPAGGLLAASFTRAAFKFRRFSINSLPMAFSSSWLMIPPGMERYGSVATDRRFENAHAPWRVAIHAGV